MEKYNTAPPTRHIHPRVHTSPSLGCTYVKDAHNNKSLNNLFCSWKPGQEYGFYYL